MSPHQFAQRLHGRAYRSELTSDDKREAAAHGLVIVTGCSDDSVSFDGAISDDPIAIDGRSWRVTKEGLVASWESINDGQEDEVEAYFRRKALPYCTVTAQWSPKDEPSLSWRIRVDAPHATFDILDEGEVFCRGIVFSLAVISTRAASPADQAVLAEFKRDQAKHDKAVAIAGDMAVRFERHFGQSWTDPEWAGEASIWAAAWKAATLPAQPMIKDEEPSQEPSVLPNAETAAPEVPHDGRCRKCRGPMIEGQALAQTFFTGREGTCSPAGPGALIPCLKCAHCGWSVTKP